MLVLKKQKKATKGELISNNISYSQHKTVKANISFLFIKVFPIKLRPKWYFAYYSYTFGIGQTYVVTNI